MGHRPCQVVTLVAAGRVTAGSTLKNGGAKVNALGEIEWAEVPEIICEKVYSTSAVSLKHIPTNRYVLDLLDKLYSVTAPFCASRLRDSSQ